MHESTRHFQTSCPSCAAKLRVNRQHDGKAVICKHCGGMFVAIDASPPSSSSSDDLPAPNADPPAASTDRIVVLCPNCRTGLSVRRVYIGASVKCKQCAHVFPVADPAPIFSIPPDAKRQFRNHRMNLCPRSRPRRLYRGERTRSSCAA